MQRLGAVHASSHVPLIAVSPGYPQPRDTGRRVIRIRVEDLDRVFQRVAAAQR